MDLVVVKLAKSSRDEMRVAKAGTTDFGVDDDLPGALLKLIGVFLHQDVIQGMKRWTPTGGTPQGAVLSPLLANIYLHPLDRKMREQGYRMVRVTHDQTEALSMSDIVAVMNKGKVIQLAAPRQIYEKPINNFVADFISDARRFVPMRTMKPTSSAWKNIALSFAWRDVLAQTRS
jgi:hypothetical protein